MIIDPTTDLGKLRLRVADFGDISYLPDSVYLQTLQDTDNNLLASTKTCAMYILGMLSFKTHRKMGLSLEVWSGEAFEQYKQFLLLTITNPAFIDVYPIPYMSSGDGSNPIPDFISDWERNYYNGTESQALAESAERSPNLGGRFGFGGLE